VGSASRLGIVLLRRVEELEVTPHEFSRLEALRLVVVIIGCLACACFCLSMVSQGHLETAEYVLIIPSTVECHHKSMQIHPNGGI